MALRKKRKLQQFKPLYLGPWLDRLGKKPVECARAVGITETYVSEIISGKKKNPNGTILLAISEWLGITINDLYQMPPDKVTVQALDRLNPSQMATLARLLEEIKHPSRK